MSSLKTRYENKGNVAEIEVYGSLTEDASFEELSNWLQKSGTEISSVAFTLSSIDRINSGGIKEWLLFLQKIKGRYKIQIKHVNEAMIDAAATTPTVLGPKGTKIDSFDVPYFCSTCQTRTLKTMTATDLKKNGGEITAPPIKCDTCNKAGKEMEFDGIGSIYFFFLEN